MLIGAAWAVPTHRKQDSSLSAEECCRPCRFPLRNCGTPGSGTGTAGGNSRGSAKADNTLCST
eukprot:685539-Prymnesium_polylepis.1